MSRIVSVWLPRWPILRFLAAQTQGKIPRNTAEKSIDPERPFVLAAAAAGGPRIAALNAAAEAAGLAPGEPLADARAKTGFLQVRSLDAAADAAALHRLALWATRYTPTASPWDEENGADGFFLDIEGSAHLFGGEESLIADLAWRLENFGLPARLAVASTPGAAWALARFHHARALVLPSGEEAAALKPLPVEALRLEPETSATLRRLGFKSVGTLLDKPRAPFAARFSAELLRRLDQAIGRIEEPLVPVVAPPVYHSLRYLIEPVFTQEAIVALASRLMQNLGHVLARDDVGARALKLSLYRVDGEVRMIDIALTLPTRSIPHVARMIELKLEALAATEDAGFGFEALGLAVTRAEPIPARQGEIASAAGNGDKLEHYAALIDTLRQRLGPQNVRRFESVESHIPERAEVPAPLTTFSTAARPRESGDPTLDSRLRWNERKTDYREASAWPAPEQQTRPLLLLPRAEPTEVTALIPDGPPRRFCWRGITYDVAGAQGPERIADEWWRSRTPHVSAHSRESGNPVLNEGEQLGPRFRGDERQQTLTRDYYLVEDAAGRRFWLFREGLYGRETVSARWFVHGLFA